MAERLKIEGNFLIIFEDGNPSIEYVNEPRGSVTPVYSSSDTVRFKVNTFFVGVGKSSFDCTTLIDDRTGLAFASVAELKTYLSTMIGSDNYTLDGSMNLSKLGWARYVGDQYTVGSPFTIAEGVTSTLPNNAASKIETYLPFGITSFYDGNKITPAKVGDYYIFTIRFKAKGTNLNSVFDFGIDIGGSLGIIFPETIIFSKGSNTEQNFSIDTPGYSLDTFLSNGGLVKITAVTGNISIYDIEFQITRVTTPE